MSFIIRGRGRKRGREKDVKEEQGRRRTVDCAQGNTTRGGSLGGGLRRTSGTGRGTNERQRASGSARTGDTSRSRPKKGRREMLRELRERSDKEGR